MLKRIPHVNEIVSGEKETGAYLPGRQKHTAQTGRLEKNDLEYSAFSLHYCHDPARGIQDIRRALSDRDVLMRNNLNRKNSYEPAV